MSGDVQPKKRKDKRRKRDEVPSQEEPVIQSQSPSAPVTPDDYNIHVHSDHGTGGGLCAKFIFFILLSVLVVLIGVIITQNRGVTDLDTPVSESRFAKIFDGWLDESTPEHEDDHAALDFGEEHAEHEASEEEHHASEEEHGDQEHDEEGHTDEDEHADEEDEQASVEDEQGNEDQHEDEDDDQVSEEQQLSAEEQQGSEEDEQQESEQQDEGSEEPQNDERDDEDDDDDKEETDQDDDKTEEADNITNEEDDGETNEEDTDEQGNVVSQEQAQDNDSGENDAQQDTNEDDNDDNNQSEDDDHGESDDNQGQSEEKYNADDGDAGSQEISTENEIIEEDSAEDQTGANDDDEQEEVIDNTAGEDELLKEEAEKQLEAEEESSNVAVKFGVGVALVVVAHIVLVRKWRSGQSKDSKTTQEEATTPTVSRRNTIVPPPPLEQIEHDIQNVEDEYSEDEAEEESEEDINIEPVQSKSEYLELRSTYRTLTPEENIREKIAGLIGRRTDDQSAFFDEPNDEYEEDENEEEIEEGYDEDDEGNDETHEHEDTQGDADHEDDEEIEYADKDEEDDVAPGEGEVEYEEEEEDISDVDDEELLKKLEVRYGKLPSKTNKADDEEEQEEDDKLGSRKKMKTAASDERTKPVLDSSKEKLKLAEARLQDNAEVALGLFNDLAKQMPDNIRVKYGHAKALDKLAETKRSNELLQDAISSYYDLLQSSDISDDIYKQVSERCIDRMRFRGHYPAAINVHRQLINRFPNEPKYQNQLAVSFLTINRLTEAKQVLQDVLMHWPNDGFAQVHFGFVLKTLDNDISAAVKYLRSGIASRQPGVIDGRFYFHLGDALTRLGRTSEATKVYEDGVKFKVFLSRYQRSLYNVGRLTARPWWPLTATPYTIFFKLLEEKWKVIREEGLALLDEAGYFKDEAENLRDVGEWKQFELYARGMKFRENCIKCPETCKLIDTFPDARNCKRGQVKFSVMHAGTHVWPHCGPTNCRLRAHLGLKVPANTFIRVAEETRSWEEGKVFLFDDSFEHEVWHNGTDIRLVLIVDLWHPELTASEKKSLPAI